ncbi:MAG: hypothetical protein HQL48_09280 [Gammaproteobacteria bacterium]|nr:hypothetical protein [Gammaproteobacteria bacterium]
MNKKLIAIAVAGVMTVPLVAQAGGHITMGGDARVRYQSLALDLPGTAGDNGARTTTRARLTLKAHDGDVAGISYRGAIADVTHGDVTTDKAQLTTDWAYGYLDTGFAKISGGVMVANWGTGLRTNDARPNRLIVTKAIDGLTLGLGFDKSLESGMGKDDTDNDSGQTVILAKTKEFGLLYLDKYKGKNVTGGAEWNATWTDIFYSGEVAGVGVNVEYGTNGGDADGDIVGLLVTKGMGKLSLAGMYVMTKDGGSIDPDYLAVVSAEDQYGASELAAMGGAGGSALASTKGEDKSVLGVVVGYEMSDAMSAQLGLVNFGSSQKDLGAGTATDSVNLVDVIVTHKFGKKSKLMGYAFSASDVATGYGLNVETKF